MEKKKRMGRPPLPKNQRRSRKVFFRVTPAIYKALVQVARQAGKPVSEFVSDLVKETVEKGE